jgi:hypothetical protein
LGTLYGSLPEKVESPYKRDTRARPESWPVHDEFSSVLVLGVALGIVGKLTW